MWDVWQSFPRRCGIRSGVDAAMSGAWAAVMIGNVAMIALGCNSPRYLDDYANRPPGACHHCHTGMCPVV